MAPELTMLSCLKTWEERDTGEPWGREPYLPGPALVEGTGLGGLVWVAAMTLWLPHRPLPELKYLYEVKKQLVLEAIRSVHSVINSSASAVLSTPGPERQGLGFSLGPGQASSRLQNPQLLPPPLSQRGGLCMWRALA